MGLQVGAVIIRANIEKFDDEEIIKHFFGSAYTEILEKDLYGKNFDTRKDECIGIYKMHNLISIVNSRFTAAFYNAGADINKAYEYFKHPAQIFAFEHYSSGGTYSYAIITRGKLIRWVRQTVDDDEHPQTYGEPLNIESKFLNAKKTAKLENDGVTHIYYIHPDTQQLFDKGAMTEVLLQEVMHHEVDLYPDTFWEKATDRRYFRLIK